MENNLLEVAQVSKQIKKHEILKNISLELFPGDIVGLIGPNGAGKTTLLRLISGLTSITSGHISIVQHDITHDFKQAIGQTGVLIEAPDFYNNLTGLENLRLFSKMRAHPTSKNDILTLINEVGLTDAGTKKVKTYSLGMRQRLGLCLTLMNQPQLLLLDEPLNGIDPLGNLEIKRLIEKIASTGTAVLISSHQLSELESLCTRYVMLEQGEITSQGLINDTSVFDLNSPLNYTISTADNAQAIKYFGAHASLDKTNQIFVTLSVTELNQRLADLAQASILLYQVRQSESNLEHLFTKKAGDSHD